MQGARCERRGEPLCQLLWSWDQAGPLQAAADTGLWVSLPQTRPCCQLRLQSHHSWGRDRNTGTAGLSALFLAFQRHFVLLKSPHLRLWALKQAQVLPPLFLVQVPSQPGGGKFARCFADPAEHKKQHRGFCTALTQSISTPGSQRWQLTHSLPQAGPVKVRGAGTRHSKPEPNHSSLKIWMDTERDIEERWEVCHTDSYETQINASHLAWTSKRPKFSHPRYIIQRQRVCPASWEKFTASFTVHCNFSAFALASAWQHSKTSELTSAQAWKGRRISKRE